MIVSKLSLIIVEEWKINKGRYELWYQQLLRMLQIAKTMFKIENGRNKMKRKQSMLEICILQGSIQSYLIIQYDITVCEK